MDASIKPDRIRVGKRRRRASPGHDLLPRKDPATTVVEVTEDGFADDDPDLIAKLVDNKEGWVYALTCLKGYMEFGVNGLRASLVK
jgi:hypothetical protein